MRARLTYLALSPRTPARVAQGTTSLLALVAGVVGLVTVASGAASSVLVSAVLLVAA